MHPRIWLIDATAKINATRFPRPKPCAAAPTATAISGPKSVPPQEVESQRLQHHGSDLSAIAVAAKFPIVPLFPHGTNLSTNSCSECSDKNMGDVR
jgi:hypothetical protein